MTEQALQLVLVQAQGKVKQLLLASKVCWVLSCAMTVNFVRQVLSGAIPDDTMAFVAAVVISVAVQYVITMTESALFDGTLPAPWNVNWSAGGSIPWLVCGALVCLMLDVLLNVGGVAYFLGRLGTTDMGQDTIKVSQSLVTGIIWIVTIVFAVFLAVGAELLKEFANFVEQRAYATADEIEMQEARRTQEQKLAGAAQREKERLDRERVARERQAQAQGAKV